MRLITKTQYSYIIRMEVQCFLQVLDRVYKLSKFFSVTCFFLCKDNWSGVLLVLGYLSFLLRAGLGKTLNSHSASLSTQEYKWIPATQCWGVTCDGLVLASHSCYRNRDKLRPVWASFSYFLAWVRLFLYFFFEISFSGLAIQRPC